MNTEKLLIKFRSKDKKRTAEKLSRFIAEGKDKLHLILDFDRTLTLCSNDSGGRATTFGALNRKLSPQVEEETVRLYKKYRPLEASGKMTTADAVEWWSTVLGFYVGKDLKLVDLAEGIKEILPARPGVKPLFDLCEAKGIPPIIISAGVKNVIDLWCREYGINPARILSTNLNLDSQGYICGWEKDSLIHVFNKREKGHDEITEIKNAGQILYLSVTASMIRQWSTATKEFCVCSSIIRAQTILEASNFMTKSLKNLILYCKTKTYCR